MNWIIPLLITIAAINFAMAQTNDAKQHEKKVKLALEIVTPSDEITTKKEQLLRATLTNLDTQPFRIWGGIDIEQPDRLYGEISLEIKWEGIPYEDWKELIVTGRYQRPTPSDVEQIESSQSFLSQVDLRYCYPLEQPGHYQIRGIFRPVRIRGLKLSVIKPVYSEWIDVVVQ